MSLKMGARVKRSGLLFIGLVFFSCGTAIADDASPPPAAVHDAAATDSRSFSSKKPSFTTREFEFTISTGTRNDNLAWSIAGNTSGTDPNVLSELDWSAVDTYQVTLANRSRFLNHIYSRSAMNYAWIQDGSVRDSDYDGDNRTLEWSRSISDSNGDNMWDLSTAVGYAHMLLDNRLMVAPLLGFSYHRQRLRITNGAQVLSERSPAPDIGPLSSQLNSTYFARWAGPWIGCDLRYLKEKPGPEYPAMVFGLSVELHYADYYGEGNWNLRSDLAHPKSFEHEADGYGVRISGEWLISLADHWDLAFTAGHQHWSTRSGTDRKFLSGGGSLTTRLNGVDWDSFNFMAGAAYHF